MMILALPIPILGGLLNRHRGGWLATGHTQLARADFALGMGLLVWLATLDWRISLVSAPLWFAGCMAPNGDWMNVRTRTDVAHGCVSGLVNVALVCAALWWFGFAWWWLLAAGALKGPVYLAASRVPSTIPNFRQGPELGELLFGFTLGLGVALA